MSAERTLCISAIDTTNFARQIVLDFEFAPVPKQRQRRGLRNEIIEVGAVKLDYHGNVMGEFSQFVQTEFTEGVAFPVRELTGISAVDTAMADRAQTRLSSKCPELGDLLLKLKAEGR